MRFALVVALAATAAGCVRDVGAGDAVDPPPQPGPPLDVADCQGLDVAPVPILPRTSTHEFQRFVSDLLGEPVPTETFAAWTPLAKVWGFDTMTEARIDAQTFEAQWETTEQLAAAIAASPRAASLCPAPPPTPPTPFCPQHATYDAIAQFSGQQGGDCWWYLDGAGTPLQFFPERSRWEGAALVWNTGLHPGSQIDVIRRWTAPGDGTVTITGSFADADPGGGDGVHVAVRRQGVELFRATIPNGSAPVFVDEAFAAGVPVIRGDAVDFVVERGASDLYDTTALAVALAFRPAPPPEGLTWEGCAGPVLFDVASRAFRRPVRPEELSALQTLFTETLAAATDAHVEGPFREALVATLQAVLLSPHVHYKPELVPGGFDPGEEHHRRAARLALYFRSSFPDDTLQALAASGGLGTDAAIAAEAERLLRGDTGRFVEDFAGQWLDFRAQLAGAPETTLQQAMRQEAHAVFDAVLHDELPPGRLIDPGFTFVDDELAAHYGLPLPGTTALSRVDTHERGGLFTQGHVLTSTARGTDFRRVIHRGLWTLTRALCQSTPMLDPATREEINDSVGHIDQALPLGEQMELHRNSSERCIGCHGQMDPLGLALERYDADGRYREQYPDGSAIDNDFDFNGISMRNPGELAAYIQESGELERCVAEKLLTFGLHRAPRREEACVIDTLSSSQATSMQQMAIDAFVASLRLTEQP